MATDLAEAPQQTTAILYSVTPETIAKRRVELLAMKVNGVNDATGLAQVRAGLKEVVKWRTSVEATRKELKAEYLEAGRKVDEDAKTIQAQIAPIEKHLADQVNAVQKELERIEEQKQDELYKARQARLTEFGNQGGDKTFILSMAEPVFEVYVANERARMEALRQREEQERQAEADRKRQAEEQAEANRKEAARLQSERDELARQKEEQEAEAARLKQIEEERLAAQRAELARQQMELQAEKDRLENERKAASDALLAGRRQQLAGLNANPTDDCLRTMTEDEFTEALARTKAVFEQQAIDDAKWLQEQAELRKAREEEEAAERAAAALRAEELKPVIQKIRDFADKVELLAIPDVPESIASVLQEDLIKCANGIRCLAASIG